MSGDGALGPFAPPETATARTGRLLVARPDLRDPNFAGSVVLLLNHSDEGSLGVVLNRPLEAGAGDVLPAWAGRTSPPDRLFQGGPVGLTSAIGVAVLPGDGPEPLGVRRLVGAFAVVDLDAPPDLVRPAVAGLRIFVGHAGWGAGQLDDELVQGSWYVVAAEPNDVVTRDAASLRRAVLRRQPTALALLSTFPDSARRVSDN
ncbi:MAG: YqgE/AlgH family protein [Kineosporiaceae bacterium]